MRLARIQLDGYSRFHNATCNVDGPVIAFVGPNEAGKSTLLRALSWLTTPGAPALPAHVLNRDSPPASYDAVVRAVFLLDEDELALVSALGLDTEEDLDLWKGVQFVAEKLADGTSRYLLSPSLHRNLAPIDNAASDLERGREAWFLAGRGEDEELESVLTTLDALLDSADNDWSNARAESIRVCSQRLTDFADKAATESQEGEEDPEVAALFDLMRSLELAAKSIELSDPDLTAQQTLLPYLPRFLLFTEDDRTLPVSFDVINDPTVPIALANLLAIANSSADSIRSAIERGPSARQTMEQNINTDLAVVGDYWSQNTSDGIKLQPHVGVNVSGVIDIGISDGEGVTAINERSDGLQTYLALISFLLSKKQDGSRTILLIDEAERNLHYDAQGDLIRLLTNDLPVAQVIYTTHSPGCLPLDLGTGIRVVARSEGNPRDSVLRENFWTDEQPGFSRLLLAMGAEAAAFSAINRALLAEGVSEMILLPRLLRTADPMRKIDFQVSFGLSNMSIPDDLGNVAIRTTYLVDGDVAGDRKIKQLARAGVPAANLLQLPAGQAIEDLIDRHFYLDMVDAIIEETQGTTISVDRDALKADVTIAKAVDLQQKTKKGFKAPGHKIVAARIAATRGEIPLTKVGRDYLHDALWPQIEAAFSAPYQMSRKP